VKVDQLGEFGLIDRIHHGLPVPSKDVIVGIGDDVAVLRATPDRVWLATCDVQMEGSHFLRSDINPRELGMKSLAINLSDIAAEGGTPRYALVSLGLPTDLELEFIDELYAGLRSEADQFGVDIVGGNISRSRLGMFIDIFLLGEAPRGEILLRSGARAGDQILVTGTLGDAAAGVAMLLNPSLKTSESYAAVARNRYHLPKPHVREGRAIAATRLATSMIDISDGLAGDLAHICEQSKVGARIVADKLPLASDNRLLAHTAHGDDFYFALYGGEDYELLFTAPVANAALLAEQITRENRTTVSIIGEILPQSAERQLILEDGRIVPLEGRGWDHFKSGSKI
jgi:thiamine-monophosphate kinase